MYTQCDYVWERVSKDSYDSAYREAEKLRALRRAGLMTSVRLPQLARRGLGRLGRLLVGLGRRLEQMGAATNRALRSPTGLEGA